MNERDLLRTGFVKDHLGDVVITYLASDMSDRTYYRIRIKDKTLVLMDDENIQNIKQFISIAQCLLNKNIRAPELYHHDFENGFLLLEDFGDETLTNVFAKNNSLKNQRSCYGQAIQILLDIQERFDEKPLDLPLYDTDAYLKETEVFADFYFYHMHHKEIPNDIKESWQSLWKKAFSSVEGLLPSTLVLRDYHVDNLVLLKNGSLGVLDFQDALWGSVVYDYISLCEDARRAITPDLKDMMEKDFLSRIASSTHQDYRYMADIVGAGRHAKILGVFSRYAIKYKNDSKLKFIPRTHSYLLNALERAGQKDLLYFLKDQGFTTRVSLFFNKA